MASFGQAWLPRAGLHPVLGLTAQAGCLLTARINFQALAQAPDIGKRELYSLCLPGSYLHACPFWPGMAAQGYPVSSSTLQSGLGVPNVIMQECVDIKALVMEAACRLIGADTFRQFSAVFDTWCEPDHYVTAYE